MPAFSEFCDTSEKFPVPVHNNIYPQLAPTWAAQKLKR